MPKYLSDDDISPSLSQKENEILTPVSNGGGSTQGSPGAALTQKVTAMWEPTQMISGTIEMSSSNWGRLVPSDMKTDSQGRDKNWTSKDLEKDFIYIGRVAARLDHETRKDSENKETFVVDDPVVSSFHCIIEKDQEENIWLTDKSTNGTYVNKSKVGRGKRRLISDGDEIVLVTSAKRDKKTKKPRKKISFFFYSSNSEDDEISAVKRKYHFKEQLGVGSFAEVWLGIHRIEGVKVAIKMIDMKRYQAMLAGEDMMQNEIKVMQTLNHQNIIRLEEDPLREGENVYLIMEYAAHGDLAKVIFDAHKKGGKALSEPQIFSMFSQLLGAISHVHENGYIHRDLKPDNVLLSSLDPIVLKLTDFGLTRNADSATSAVGSQIYSAPEVFTGKYGQAVDMWSLGCILYALFNGNPPFYDAENRPPFREQQQSPIKFGKKKWKDRSKWARDLICRLCMFKAQKRITIEKIYEHKWYNEHCKKRKRSDDEDRPQVKRRKTDSLEVGNLLDKIQIGTQLTSQASMNSSTVEASSVSSDFQIPLPRKKFRRMA